MMKTFSMLEIVVRLHPRNESGFTKDEEGRFFRSVKGAINNALFHDTPIKNWDVELVEGNGLRDDTCSEQAVSRSNETVRPKPKEPTVVLMARSTDSTGEFWRCWHVARGWPNGSLKSVCGVWLRYDGQTIFPGRKTETADPEGFSFSPREPGEICGRRGCVEAIEKL